jgi:hypothetical protein
MRLKQLLLILISAVVVACGKEAQQTTPPTTSSAQPATASSGSARAASTTGTTDVTTVKVHITGLISFGPGTRSTTGGLDSKMVYILDASGDAHHAVVLSRNMFKPTSEHTIVDEPAGSGADPVAFKRVDLSGDPLEFIGVDAVANPLKYMEDGPKDPKNVCPDASENTSLYFFPRISTVVPDTDNKDPNDPTHKKSKKLDATDFDNDHVHPAPGSSTIAGWIEVSYGTLTANILNPIVWDFKVDPASFGATHRQQIAQEALWVFTITGDTLTLKSQKDSKKVIELKAQGNQIELWLANATQGGIDSIAQHIAGKHEPIDNHFTHFYDYFTVYLKNPTDPAHPRYKPVVAGVCRAPGDFSSQPCDIFHAVDIPRPPQCTGDPATGDVNCGPTGIP